MKKLTLTLLASLALVATTFAGQQVSSGKDSKDYKGEAFTCFNDRELQFDTFGVYVDGNASRQAGPIRDHGWGGGIGVNYFFSRNIGIGAEGFWIAAHRNSAQDGLDPDNNGRTTFHNVHGSLIFRFPIDSACLAPYAYLGGGADLAAKHWAVGFAGLGVEYRVIPHKVGLFIDGRWNYYGDRYGQDDQNNFAARAGVRLVF